MSTFFTLAVLAEETLMSFSLDSLFELMIQKIQELKLLDKYHAYNGVYKEVKEEIKLIQKIIVIQKLKTQTTLKAP